MYYFLLTSASLICVKVMLWPAGRHTGPVRDMSIQRLQNLFLFDTLQAV